MPSTKRPLAQANTNVILPPQKKNKGKCVPSNNDYESKTKEDQLAGEAQEAADAEKNDKGGCEKDKEEVPTACPSTAGVILTSGSIYAQKDNKTERYIYLEVGGLMVNVEEQALKALRNPGTDYETLDYSVLNKLASARDLSTHGDREALIKRLRADDQKPSSKSRDKSFMRDAIKELTASLKTHKNACDKAKRDLEKSLGHPVLDIATVMKVHKAVRKRDDEITYSYQPVHKPGPICDYDWKDSHWAKRSERELRDICQRQGMKGWGTKATGIKWLETGSVEYEELSAASLQTMCMDRGIKVKSHELRLDLARKLREADEKEIAYRDLGIMALKKLCKERGMQVKTNESKQDLITGLRQADESTRRS